MIPERIRNKFFFLKDKEQVCPNCNQQDILVNGLCIPCLMTKKAYEVIEKGGDLDKPYIRLILNDGKATPLTITTEVLNSLWKDIKSDYYRKYLEDTEEKENVRQ